MILKKPKFWDLKKSSFLVYLFYPLTIFVKINNIISNVNQTSNELAGLSGSFSDLSIVISNLSESSENIDKIISEIFKELSLSSNKAEKDIGIYKSTISKMEQAKELIQELRIKDKKKD